MSSRSEIWRFMEWLVYKSVEIIMQYTTDYTPDYTTDYTPVGYNFLYLYTFLAAKGLKM